MPSGARSYRANNHKLDQIQKAFKNMFGVSFEGACPACVIREVSSDDGVEHFRKTLADMASAITSVEHRDDSLHICFRAWTPPPVHAELILQPEAVKSLDPLWLAALFSKCKTLKSGT